MKIPKEKILEFVDKRGRSDDLARAYDELPEYVDLADDAELLAEFGIDPSEVLGEFNGDSPGLTATP